MLQHNQIMHATVVHKRSNVVQRLNLIPLTEPLACFPTSDGFSVVSIVSVRQ